MQIHDVEVLQRADSLVDDAFEVDKIRIVPDLAKQSLCVGLSKFQSVCCNLIISYVFEHVGG